MSGVGRCFKEVPLLLKGHDSRARLEEELDCIY